MLTATLPRSLTALRSPSKLLYRRSGLHPDGLLRTRQLKATPNGTSACYRADRLGNPRWGLDYVIATIGPSWEIGTEQTNILTEEQQFLQELKDLVSLPSPR
jgi:hypothetical protein